MPAGPVFCKVRNVSFAGTPFGGVSGLAWLVSGRERRAGADDERWLSLLELGGWSVRVEVATDFPEAALARFAPGASGELSFTLVGVSSGATPDLAVTVAGARLVELGAAPEHGEVRARGRLVFQAVANDGASCPLAAAAVPGEA